MTKNEYMAQLKQGLSSYRQDLREEIIQDFEEHFNDGIQAGLSEAEIIEKLGPVDQVIGAIDEKPQQSPAIVNDNKAITNLQVDCGQQEIGVKLYPATDGQISYRLYDRSIYNNVDYQIIDQLKDNTLQLRVIPATSASAHLSITIGRIFLQIYLPQPFDSISMISTSGNMESGSVAAGKWNLQTGSGDISLHNGSGQVIAVCGSGDIEVSQWQGDISMMTSSGDIDLDNITGSIKAVSRSGDIDIDDASSPVLVAASTSGDIEASSDSAKATLSSTSGDIEYEAGGSLAELTAVSTSGDVEIRLADDTAVSGLISTGSGDIDIDCEQDYIKTKKAVRFDGGRVSVSIVTTSGDVNFEK